MSVIRKPLDEWIGPWFRTRTTPPKGTLETSHICVAVVNAVDMNESLFTQEEMEEIKTELYVNYFPIRSVIVIGSFTSSEILNKYPSKAFSNVIPVCIVFSLKVKLELIT